MPTYFTLLTPAGLAKVANAQLTNEKIEISQVAVGDGNGSAYQPLGTETALRREVWRGGIASIEIDTQNPNWIVVEGVIPASAGGFTIREVGLFDTDGAMIAIGNYPDTYKPVIADGSTMDLALRTIIEVNNASSVSLKVDPNVIVASRKYVDDRLASSSRALSEHTSPTAIGAHTASNIALVDSEGNFVSNEVESAMKELFTSVSNGKNLVGTAITDADDSLVVPTNPTFQNLADLIGSINTGKKWASGTATPMSTTKLFKTTSTDVSSYFIEIRNLEFEPSFIVAFDYSEYNSAYPTVYAKGGIVSFQGKIGHAVANNVRYVYGGNMTFLNGTFTLPIELSTGSRQWIAFE